MPLIAQIISGRARFNLSDSSTTVTGLEILGDLTPPETASWTWKLLEWLGAWSSDRPDLRFWVFASARMVLMKRKSNVTHAGVDTQEIYHLIPMKCRGGAGWGGGGGAAQWCHLGPLLSFPSPQEWCLLGRRGIITSLPKDEESVPLDWDGLTRNRSFPQEIASRNMSPEHSRNGSWLGILGAWLLYTALQLQLPGSQPPCSLPTAVGYLTCLHSQVFIFKTLDLWGQQDEDWLCLINGDGHCWLSSLVGEVGGIYWL